MDRYVIRQQRVGNEHPEGNQMIAFSATSTGNNITIPEHVYFNTYNSGFQNSEEQYMAGPSTMVPQMQTFSPNVVQPQYVPGIDPRYLAAYSNNNASYIATGQNMIPSPVPMNPFSDYQNHNLMGVERTEKHYAAQRIPNARTPFNKPLPTQRSSSFGNIILQKKNEVPDPMPFNQPLSTPQSASSTGNVIVPKINEGSKKQPETDLLKSETEVETKVKIREEKLKELYKTGTRVFSGNVENITKWHKMIQNSVGSIVVFYEIVGKCVSVTKGEACAKNLVVRDDNGPAMQVVYYEVDFLLPELKPPCTVRVLGRIVSGTNRLHAFSVRVATGDDLVVMPRRAAVSAHHVAKLCKEYSKLYD